MSEKTVEELQKELTRAFGEHLTSLVGTSTTPETCGRLRAVIEQQLAEFVGQRSPLDCGLHVVVEQAPDDPDRADVRLLDKHGRPVFLNTDENRLESYDAEGRIAWCFPDRRLNNL